MSVRRIAYGGLGVLLITCLATLSWLGIDLALIAALVVLGLEVRRLRIQRGAERDRGTATRQRLAEQHALQASLAIEMYDHGVLLGRPFPVELTPLVLCDLVTRGDALDAYLLAVRGHLAGAQPPVLRRLRDSLQRRGYQDWALIVAGHLTGSEPDRRVLAMLRGEIAVTTGAFTPVVAPAEVTGVPGRVLHLAGESLPYSTDGHTLRTHYTVTAQRAAGLDPHVATRTGFPAGGGASEVVGGVTHHRLAGPAPHSVPQDVWLARHVANVAELARSLRPAVLHAASDHLNALAAETVGAAYGIPVVYESCGFGEETYLARQFQRYGWDPDTHADVYGLPDVYLRRREIEDRVRRRADRVLTLAAAATGRIAQGGVAPDRIEVLPNAVDVASFPVVSRDAELAARYGIDPAATVIGCIGSLAEDAGMDTLITAYAQVEAVADGPVALLVVGDGDGRADLERRVAELGIAGAHFTGQVPHDAILGHYSLIDVFVVPGRPAEGCHPAAPLKLFEAFATGRTVVLSDARAPAAVASESDAAELFTAGDPDSLAAVLVDLLRHPDRRRELAAAGAAWVRAGHTWAANAQTCLRLYAQLRATRVPRQLNAAERRAANR